MEKKEPYISVVDLTMAYGDFVVMRNLNFSINRGDIFIIMGGSGCGKSTLLRHMIGLKPPAKGDILYGDFNFWKAEPGKASADDEECGHPLSERRPVELHDPG